MSFSFRVVIDQSSHGDVRVKGRFSRTGSRTGFSRPYHAFDVTRIDNVLYVAVKAPRQTRVLYLAFGYARNGDDSSSIRVVDPAARSDKRDKCTLIPTN